MNIFPSGIIFLQKFDLSPFTPDYRHELANLRRLCGDFFLSRVTLVATMPHITHTEQWMQDLEGDAHYWRYFIAAGAKKGVFDGTEASAREIVGWVRESTPCELQIQQELARSDWDVEATSGWHILDKPEDDHLPKSRFRLGTAIMRRLLPGTEGEKADSHHSQLDVGEAPTPQVSASSCEHRNHLPTNPSHVGSRISKEPSHHTWPIKLGVGESNVSSSDQVVLWVSSAIIENS